MLEEEEGVKGQLKYVIFPDKGEAWRVQAVPISNGSFKNRLGLFVLYIFCACGVMQSYCEAVMTKWQ